VWDPQGFYFIYLQKPSITLILPFVVQPLNVPGIVAWLLDREVMAKAMT
jgi:hypothetical protein